MTRSLLLLTLLVGLSSLNPIAVYADDGIPDNCETAPDDRINLFVRYEAHNRRLLLVDWTTGVEALVIDTDLPALFQAVWSPDCRYLAVAVAASSGFETVVYDLDTVSRVGTVPDAQGKPHPLTWGPPPYLLVETRHGALLWNVQSNVQLPLTTAYNTTTGRNFSRIRWDAANHQVSVNLAVGGREVYDLRTGQQIPEAANVTDSIPDAPGYTGMVTIGGKPYECQAATRYGYRNWNSAPGIAGVQVDFNMASQTLFIRLRNDSARIEALQMIEADLNASWFRFMGWSASCRYFVAYLGVPGQDASDTVVWDVVANQRLGVIPDARFIPHPLSRRPYEDALFVQTRSGGILWHLPTNTQTRITTDVATALTGSRGLKNVAAYQWEAGRLLVQPLQAEAIWDSYAVETGQLIATGIPQTPETYTPPMIAQSFVPPHPVAGETGYSVPLRQPAQCQGQTLDYDAATRTLSVVDSTGTPTSVIEAELNPTRASWSPDCRWVFGVVDAYAFDTQPYDQRPLDDIFRDRLTDTLILWEAASGQRRFVLDHPYSYGSFPAIRWSPGYDRAVAYTSNGSYLLNLHSGEQVLLTFSQGDGRLLQPHLTAFYWDYPRGQVLINGRDGVYAFDLTTGIERYRFAGGYDFWHSRFTVADNLHLYIMGGWSASIWIWNLDTLDYRAVRLDRRREVAFGGSRIALSPDERYLVMGYTTIRVWDLATETAITDRRQVTREPDAYYPVPGANLIRPTTNRVTEVIFLDNTTLQITTRRGNLLYMDISTGTILEAP